MFHGERERLLVNLSTLTTALTLSYEEHGGPERLLLWNGQSSAARINLPSPSLAPEFKTQGLEFNFLFTTGAVSSATKIISNGYTVPSPGGGTDIQLANPGTTAVAVACGTTQEAGFAVKLVSIGATRWWAYQVGASTVDSINLESTST